MSANSITVQCQATGVKSSSSVRATVQQAVIVTAPAKNFVVVKEKSVMAVDLETAIATHKRSQRIPQPAGDRTRTDVSTNRRAATAAVAAWKELKER